MDGAATAPYLLADRPGSIWGGAHSPMALGYREEGRVPC